MYPSQHFAPASLRPPQPPPLHPPLRLRPPPRPPPRPLLLPQPQLAMVSADAGPKGRMLQVLHVWELARPLVSAGWLL